MYFIIIKVKLLSYMFKDNVYLEFDKTGYKQSSNNNTKL